MTDMGRLDLDKITDAQPERDLVAELRAVICLMPGLDNRETLRAAADELAALRERLRYTEMTIAQCDAPTELQRRYDTPEFRKAYAETKDQEPPTLEPVEPTQPERDLVEWLRDYTKRLRNCEANKAAETIMKADAARMEAAADKLAALRIGNADLIEERDWLSQHFNRAAGELADLTAKCERLEAWVNDLQAGMYINCVYCGHRYGPDDEVAATMADALKDHIEQCPSHPMSKLKAENVKLRKNHETVIGSYNKCCEENEVLEVDRDRLRKALVKLKLEFEVVRCACGEPWTDTDGHDIVLAALDKEGGEHE